MTFLEFWQSLGVVLKSLGLELPSLTFIAGMVLFSVIGMVAWWHGKKARRPTIKWLGLALMLYSYATPQTWLLYAIGAALCAGLLFAYFRGESGTPG